MSRAGSRIKKYRPGYGRLGDNKIAWLRTHVTNQLTIQELDPEEFDEENNITMSSETGSSFVLLIPVPGRQRPLVWNFSAMTTEELEATRQFFEHLFDLADPVVRERDKVAADAFAEGDDSYNRVYRAVPQFIKRQRQKRTDDQGLRNRLDRSSEGTGDGRDFGRGVRGNGDELADSESEDRRSQDHGPTAD